MSSTSVENTTLCVSYLQSLMNEGHNEDKAKKALAATGYRGVPIAHNWLLSHAKDLRIEDSFSREYTLYLCPTGKMMHNLNKFFAKSLKNCGWNGAHNCIPHITLIPFFEGPDDKVEEIIRAVKQELNTHDKSIFQNLKLELYISQNYMGLFVSSGGLIKNVAQNFMSNMMCKGIQFNTKDFLAKSLHLTLSYHFKPEYFTQLTELIEECIDCSLDCNWELRVYSRDPLFSDKQVYKVLYCHLTQESDELELMIGDYVYVNENAIEKSRDGWVEGISFVSGLKGHIPFNYLERIAMSDAWTIHPISGEDEPFGIECKDGDHINSKDEELLHPNRKDEEPKEEEQEPPKRSGNDSSDTHDKNNDDMPICKRELYIMRHGERVDFTFGRWIPVSFDSKDNYIQKDLNMPASLPNRTGGIQAFFDDCPLTNVGEFQARLTGEGMNLTGVKVHYAFASPSLRCVQTCHNVLRGLGIDKTVPICIEPGLFEWTAWYEDGFPDWMTTKEFTEFGFNIDCSYVPVIPEEKLPEKETMEEYYERSYTMTCSIIEQTEKKGGNVLFVGHATTLDTCSRRLVGKRPRGAVAATNILPFISYCSILRLEYSNFEWSITESPCPPLTQSSNIRFDYKLISESL